MAINSLATSLGKPHQISHKGKIIMSNNAAVAAIQYALATGTEERIEFLRCWNEGNFEAIRKEWPDAPEEVFKGADPLHKDGEIDLAVVENNCKYEITDHAEPPKSILGGVEL